MLLTVGKSGSDFTFVLKGLKPPARAKYQKKLRLFWAFDKSTGQFSTTDFRAAARFKRIADEKACEVLNKAFVKIYPAPSAPLPTFLKPHQVDGVTWILTRSRSYLAHAPGAGKTVEAIIASLLIDKWLGQTVFVVPPTLTMNWSRQIMKWTAWKKNFWPSISIVPVSAKKTNVDWTADYLIVPDTMITKRWVLDALTRIKIKFLAVDEASRFKDPAAKRTIAFFGGTFRESMGDEVLKSPGLLRNSYIATLMDGSPEPNRPIELWAPTYAMSPESIDFMSYDNFGYRYGGPTCNDYGQWEYKGSSHEEELKQKLRKSFMHVVPESALDHPERVRKIVFTNNKAIPWDRKLLSNFRLSEAASTGELAVLRKNTGLSKVEWVSRYTAEKIEAGNAVLLFAWHRPVVEALYEALKIYRPGLVMGGTKESDRERDFGDFEKAKRNLVIGNIQSLGRGHDKLKRANRCIFGEFSWNDESNKQAEKRGSREGSTHQKILCDYTVVPNSIEEIILKSVFRKSENVRKVMA